MKETKWEKFCVSCLGKKHLCQQCALNMLCSAKMIDSMTDKILTANQWIGTEEDEKFATANRFARKAGKPIAYVNESKWEEVE